MPSPAVITAATSLAEWARERRRTWSDVPLPRPEPPSAPLPAMMAGIAELAGLKACTARVDAGPSVFARVVAGARAAFLALWVALNAVEARLEATTTTAGATARAMLMTALERSNSLVEPSVEWLIRGAAIVSTLSVVMLGAMNRGQLFSGWDRVAAGVTSTAGNVASRVVVAAHRPAPPPPQPQGPPAGSGRLTVESDSGTAVVLVDGTPRGTAPVTVDLPAGAHRVLLKSPKGIVERTVSIQAGESSEMREAIFPGWVALSSPIDLSLSEDGRPLQRDERGWVILPPGPHDIQLDNRSLGVHEVRHVLVTPGDTTRLSLAPRTSTLSLTTNEPAEVWIDGVSFGEAPLVDQPVALGVHDVRLRSGSRERWLRVHATVSPVQVNVDLSRTRD